VAYLEYGDVHLLGYWIEHHDPLLCEKLRLFRERRETRGLRVIENINSKLTEEGKSVIESARVMALAAGAVGRPHIARILMESGHVATMQEAFNNYLEPCNVPKEYFPFAEAVSEIQRTGGVAVLAHPQSISRDRQSLTAIITDMAGQGLDGIEAFNTMGFNDDDRFLKTLAGSLGLIATGGSDFHGGEEGLAMGRGRGNLYLTTELLPPLQARRRKVETDCSGRCTGQQSSG
jgi:predicted metal-dependent phosphoesterase TrpH